MHDVTLVVRFSVVIATACFRNYPDQEVPPMPGQLRASPHTDYGSLTILLPDDAPGGLQVLHDCNAALLDLVVIVAIALSRLSASGERQVWGVAGCTPHP